MRWLLLAAFLVGCGEQSTAIGVGLGGSGGSGGSGQAGTTGTAGDVGMDAGSEKRVCDDMCTNCRATCTIAQDQVSTSAQVDGRISGSSSASCLPRTEPVSVMNGILSDSDWSQTGFSIGSTGSFIGCPNLCDVSLSYKRTTTKCGTETLTVSFSIPGI